MKFFSFLIFSMTAISCTSREKPGPTTQKKPAKLNLVQLKNDTIECGAKGSLLARIHDCKLKNPAISTYATAKGQVGWQQVMYQKSADFHLWMDHAQGLIWSSAIKPSKMSHCFEEMDFKNGNKEVTVRWPTLSEYRKLFEYQLPPLLYQSTARFFKHNDLNETKMAVDEKDAKFRNAPMEKELWVRCVAD